MPDGKFDFVLSLITLQHIPPPLVEGYLTEFLRVLAPGGMAYFQMAAGPVIPENQAGGLRQLVRGLLPAPVLARIRTLRTGLRARKTGGYEVHGIPRPRMEQLILEREGRLVNVSEDRLAGPEWTSFTYTVLKG